MRLTPEIALIQTVDYFTPVVDEPYWFGQIAAANALSDVYAMGGRPLTVMNLVGFPIRTLPGEWLSQILIGAADKTREAGAILVGGHSIDDQEPKFGLSVTGIVHPQELLTNAGAKPGDALVLSKPIGAGVMTTALKRGALSVREVSEITNVMASLNDVVDEMRLSGATACTDVTGYGLLGHALELAAASGVGVVLDAGEVPVVEGAWRCLEEGHVPGGTNANRRWLEPHVDYDPSVTPAERTMLCDAMTSGGLLISIPEEKAPDLLVRLKARGTLAQSLIGHVTAEPAGRIQVV